MTQLGRRGVIAGGAGALTLAALGPAARAAGMSHRVPAEEDPHERTFMQWPVSRAVYRDPDFLDDVQGAIAEIANAIAEFEPVTMLAAGSYHAAARRRLSEAVELWDAPTEDLWARDSGPLFTLLEEGGLAVSHIRFNGWGAKQIHKHDARIAETVARRLGLPVIDSGLVGEAGGVEQDGAGLLMAHESCWVNPNRNPGLGRAAITERLLAAYGAERMVWAPGLRGRDITDYHIDSLARFTGPGRVLMNLPDAPDPEDPFHHAAFLTRDRLAAAGLAIDTIPDPRRPRVKSPDFLASYVNSYVCNGAVVAAQFGDAETDARAVAALARHYPGREIVTLNVDPLGELGGGVHCATQQMPAA